VSQIDLNNPPPNHKYTVSIDREETTGERGVRLFKDVALFLIAAGFVVAIAVFCYQTMASTTAAADEKKWAMSILSAATAGLIGYLIRK
jgi:hypothetical protein